MLAAARSPRSRRARPPRRITTGSSESRTFLTDSIVSAGTDPTGGTGRGRAGVPATGPQEISAGTTRVAIPPGGTIAAATASVASAARSSEDSTDPDPLRDVAGKCDDVGLEGSIESLVIGGVVADDVHDRRAGPPGIVQVGDAVSEPRAHVEQGRCRASRHPAVAVSRPGHHAFEEGQHRAHLGDVVEGRHEVHLRGARIGEADVNLRIDQRADQRLGTGHHASRCLMCRKQRRPRFHLGSRAFRFP